MKAIKVVLAIILFPFGIFFWVPLIARVGMAHIGAVLYFSIIRDQIDETKQKPNLQAAFDFLWLLYQNIFTTARPTAGSITNPPRPFGWVKTWLNIVWAVLFWATILVPIFFPTQIVKIKSVLFPMESNGDLIKDLSVKTEPVGETVETRYPNGALKERYKTRNGEKHGRYELRDEEGNLRTAREFVRGRLMEVYFVRRRDGTDVKFGNFLHGNGTLYIYDNDDRLIRIWPMEDGFLQREQVVP